MTAGDKVKSDERPVYVSRETLRQVEMLSAQNRVMGGRDPLPEDWQHLTVPLQLRLWLLEDPSVNEQALRDQGLTDQEIEHRRFPRRAELIEHLPPAPSWAPWVGSSVHKLQRLAHLAQHQPWSSELPAEFQKPWADTMSQEQQDELWAYEDPNVDVPTLMRNEGLTQEQAEYRKYPGRRELATWGRPSPVAQQQYAAAMNVRWHRARIEAQRSARFGSTEMSPHDQRRRQILEVMDRNQRKGDYDSDAVSIASELDLSAQDVEEDLELLIAQGRAELTSTMGAVSARLTAEGRQWVREGVASSSGRATVHQPITFLAPVNTINLAQSGTGDVFQHVEQPGGVTEIRRLLGEMRQAVAASDLGDDRKEEGLVYLEQIGNELQQANPRPSMLKIPWEALSRIADIAGAAQGSIMVFEAYRQLEPLITPMLRTAGG